jgi:glycosyltransferase involved in cell wall biosynthesis
LSNNTNKRLWISWEKQRRSIELAHHFGCLLYILDYNGWLRYPKSIIETFKILKEKKPKILFVQNPSMVLASLACVYGIVTSTYIIVDRHTTFLLSKQKKINVRLIIFKLLHIFTIKYADITIVTNNYLADKVSSLGGISYVLPDKLPEFKNYKKIELNIEKTILYITSFSKDEPINEVFSAMSLLEKENIYMYVSGNYTKLTNDIINNCSTNIIFTGYLPDEDFVNLLHSVDVVLVLTEADYCMLCGCYEAVSANKPLVTSSKDVLKEYFIDAVFVENNSISISNGIKHIFENIKSYKENVGMTKLNMDNLWKSKSQNIEQKLNDLNF